MLLANARRPRVEEPRGPIDPRARPTARSSPARRAGTGRTSVHSPPPWRSARDGPATCRFTRPDPHRRRRAGPASPPPRSCASQGFRGEVTILCDEQDAPYDRPAVLQGDPHRPRPAPRRAAARARRHGRDVAARPPRGRPRPGRHRVVYTDTGEAVPLRRAGHRDRRRGRRRRPTGRSANPACTCCTRSATPGGCAQDLRDAEPGRDRRRRSDRLRGRLRGAVAWPATACSSTPTRR